MGSLCYWLLPKAFNHLRGSKSVDTQSIVIVVSPPIALMKDQVRQMTERNVSAVYVGEAESATETQVCEGQFQLVYVSPEALLTNPTWRDMLQSSMYQSNLVALIVDEAHCVKKWLVIVLSFLMTMMLFYVIVCQNICLITWGDTFRKEFSQAGDVRSLIPEMVQIMVLTATATNTTRRAIIRVLRMVNPEVVSISPNKVNIKYAVKLNLSSFEEMFAPLVEKLRQERKGMERTLVFCRKYDQCSRIYMFMAD